MEFYIDLSCLQHANEGCQDFVAHVTMLLRAGRKFFSTTPSNWIGLVDASLPPLDNQFVELVDRVITATAPDASHEQRVLLQLSPLMGTTQRLQRFLTHPDILAAAVVHELPSEDLSQHSAVGNRELTEYWAKLAGLDLYDLVFPISDEIRQALTGLRAVADFKLHVTGATPVDAAQPDPCERVAYRVWGRIWQSLRVANRSSGAMVRSKRRRRIAILSPFPPDRSGVADYTRRSVEEIGKYLDIDIYCDTPHPRPTSAVQHFMPLTDLPYRFGGYDRVVSVVGNSHFHAKIVDAQVRHGGPCLVHDNRLAELYHWWKGPEAFRQMACRSLGRKVAFHEAQEWLREPGKLPSLFFDELIPSAQPLMVHSRGIQAQVKQQYQVAAHCLPFCVYRDFAECLLTQQAKRRARYQLGIADDVLAVVTLGIVGASKAPRTCIEAIARLRQAGVNAHLYFVGASSGQDKSLRRISKNFHVSQAIHTCGDWLDEQTYTDFVVAADLAVQLRTHCFGGLSGAMLDCIASGLVTVANCDLAEALEAPASVLRVSDQLDSDEVARQMLVAVEGYELNHRLTPDRSKYLHEHSFTAYARHFLDAIGLPVIQQNSVAA